MHAAADDIVPSAIVAAEQLIEVLVLENVRIAESGYIQRVGAIGSSWDHRTLLELGEVSAISRDCETCGLGAFGVGDRPVDGQV